MVFTYNLLSLSLPPTATRTTAVQHHNRNQFRLTGWAGENSRPEPSQGNDDVRNMQWMLKEVIHNNNNVFM